MAAGAERTVSQRELNRALLARQLLLERVQLPIPRALERIGGIQNQYAPNAYIRLWSCLESFERDDLTRALERRTVVQGTLMRETIHLVSPRDYWPFAIGTREARQRWWLRVHKNASRREVMAKAKRMRSYLSDGPRRVKEVDEFLGSWLGVPHWLELVRVPPSGTWDRRRADMLATAEDWLGPGAVSEADALDHLVRRYLTAVGPAPRADVAKWAGVQPRDLAPVLERLKLRRFGNEGGKELLDVPRGLLPDPETPAPVRFLPTWDATLLVHARRTGILPEKYRSRVFNTKTPQSVATFLVDGEVAGSWRYENGRVRLEPYGRISRSARKELNEEAERLAELHA